MAEGGYKKMPCPVPTKTPMQGSEMQYNLSLDRNKYKVACRFLLQKAVQQLIFSRFPDLRNSNFCKCSTVHLGDFVAIKRNPETQRAYYHGVVTCSSPLLCPVCSPRIMGYRSGEIMHGVHEWLSRSEENTCYLLTFTLQHSLADSLVDLLSLFADARQIFWRNGSVRRLLSLAGSVGRITSTEIQFSSENGWHPHQHALLFCRKSAFDVEFLRSVWVSALEFVGLSGIGRVAFDLIEARSAAQYLTKLSHEVALGALKEGRGHGHYSIVQMMQEVFIGEAWAFDRFAELFDSMRGLHCLTWSRGLKKSLGISDVSDSDITLNSADASQLIDYLTMTKKVFSAFSPAQKGILLDAVAADRRDEVVKLFASVGAGGFADDCV